MAYELYLLYMNDLYFAPNWYELVDDKMYFGYFPTGD